MKKGKASGSPSKAQKSKAIGDQTGGNPQEVMASPVSFHLGQKLAAARKEVPFGKGSSDESRPGLDLFRKCNLKGPE